MTPPAHEIGIGATGEFSLRVSVAALVRVLFIHPDHDELMLALERKATLHRTEDGESVRVKAQPFGGGLRISDLDTVHDLVGGFQFDSERSRTERDFRIFIRPLAWPALREFCVQHIGRNNDVVFETSPARELTEEFAETLGIDLKPEQYVCKPLKIMVENRVATTDNMYARGTPTVRIYRTYEAGITDVLLARTMLKRSASLSHQSFSELALADAQGGGRGKANAILTLPWERLQRVYREMSQAERNAPIMFEDNRLDSTVAAILEKIAVPRYQNVLSLK
jgi:hypothetical protein